MDVRVRVPLEPPKLIKKKQLMTQQDKELLPKDLCARLFYRVEAINSNGVKGTVVDIDRTYNSANILYDVAEGKVAITPITQIKPYLRPMSSMTEEEMEKYNNTWEDDRAQILPIGNQLKEIYARKNFDSIWQHPVIPQWKHTDWLNEHHFDYRGLIEKGLAIEVTKENNPYK